MMKHDKPLPFRNPKKALKKNLTRSIPVKNGLNPKYLRRGIAMVEILPLLVVFITFFGLAMGFWGAVHSGTLQSIAARHYAFEVINNRTHIEYHRDWNVESDPGTGNMFGTSPKPGKYHGQMGMRLFAIVTKQANDPDAIVENRGLNFFSDIDRKFDELPGGILSSPQTEDSAKRYSSRAEFLEEEELFIETPQINPIWLMNGYGICLNCCCGETITGWPCKKDCKM